MAHQSPASARSEFGSGRARAKNDGMGNSLDISNPGHSQNLPRSARRAQGSFNICCGGAKPDRTMRLCRARRAWQSLSVLALAMSSAVACRASTSSCRRPDQISIFLRVSYITSKLRPGRRQSYQGNVNHILLQEAQNPVCCRFAPQRGEPAVGQRHPPQGWPTSDRNGRHHVGISGRHHIGMPGRLAPEYAPTIFS